MRVLKSLIIINIVIVQVWETYCFILKQQSKSNLHELSRLVVFSFDGFRHDYVNALDTPNLYALANDGVRGHMRSAFVTKTYPNHHTITTGLYEQYHGIVNNEFIDPLRPKEHFDVDDSSTFWWDMYNRTVPIYIANQLYEPNIRFSGAVQWPGSIAAYTDGTGRNDSKRYRIHYLQEYEKMSWNRRIDLVIQWLTDPSKPANLVFIYFPEPDSSAHRFGPFSTQVMDNVRKLDQCVGYFRKRLTEIRLSHRTNLIFLSDHGMAEIYNSSQNVFYIERCLKNYPGLSFTMHGVSPVYSIETKSGPNGFIPPETPIPIQVMKTLNECSKKLFNGKFTVYESDKVPQELHYSENRRMLQLFLVADDGYEVYDRGSWLPNNTVWGNHGYNNSAPSMRPLFIAQGPRFRSGYKHETIFDNVDLFPLMLHLLSIPINRFHTNGSFEHVRTMLTNQLYDNDDDYIQNHMKVPLNTDGSLFQVFLYVLLGLIMIIFIAICFITGLGIFRDPSRRSTKRRRVRSILTKNDIVDDVDDNDRTLISNLFARFIKSGHNRHSQLRNSFYENGSNRTGYHKFHNGPTRHLDSSFDSDYDDDDDNYELNNHENGLIDDGHGNVILNDKKKKNGKQLNSKSMTQDNDITDIDWDIMGTGLDIDLESHLKANGSSIPYDNIDGDGYDDDDDCPILKNKQESLLSKQEEIEIDNVINNGRFNIDDEDTDNDDLNLKRDRLIDI
ncbi:hypothetical protein RDWZM_009964 [Blomia tropicalis]|uniref:Uncharacterized protein n=1 Tax=Blomia tropicalis TaxID=40697 RepID=A0A9Q0LY55_BLOTA|nr:hypothetical protein RDWZM_009964 [Blomia tropicalis]